jgi:hypothetical protein
MHATICMLLILSKTKNNLTMKFLVAALLAGSAAAFAPAPSQGRVSTSNAAAIDDLKEVAAKANPILKFFDPLGLSDQNFWGTTSDETSK